MQGDDGSWASKYRAGFGAYDSCAAKLKSLLLDLLEDAQIDVVALESRAKAPESLERKVEEKRETYENPLLDVTDLIGVRVIAYYLEDVDKICEIIRREFVVDAENSSDKLDGLEPDRFGYRSVHFVMSLNEPRASLAEWAVFEGKKAEIQVRTATQHAWAAVEHKLNYKRASEAPRKLRRKLMRLSALFELADEQFSVVKDELEDVEASYSDEVRGGNLDLPIDTSSLDAFLRANPLVADVIERFQSRGLAAKSSLEGYQERYARDLRDLVMVCESIELRTIAELERSVRTASEDHAEIERLISVLKTHYSNLRSPADLLTFLLGVDRKVPIQALESAYNKFDAKVFKELRGEPLVEVRPES